MKINIKDFQVTEGKKIELKKYPTIIRSFYKSKDQYKEILARHIEALSDMQSDGLITMNTDAIKVLPAGRLLIRNICMVFDRYLAQKQQQFSKVI